jgi:membrane associated rhomboid family serine protease
MFFPIGDDNPSSRTPYVTYGIIGANVVVFLFVNKLGVLSDLTSLKYGFRPGKFEWYTLFTSMFLHGDFLHILGNMIFLWIAGDNVEEKLGRIAFLVFYLISGVCACLFYMLFVELGARMVPLVGASGAIAGVLGCYMIFFPTARIRVFYWFFFFFLGTIFVQAKWFLGLWIALNVFDWLVVGSQYVTGVAYAAHVGGFAVGVIVAVVAKGHLRKRGQVSQMDELTGFAKPGAPPRPGPQVQSSGPDPVYSEGKPDFVRPTYVSPRTITDRETSGFFGREEAIAENVKAGRIDVALDRYEEYVHMRHAKPLPAWAQIEIASELYRRGDYEQALQAYRRYLAHSPAGADSAEAKFRLGIILSRHRKEFFRAREYLLQATMEHPDNQVVEFAREELERIEPHL